MFGADALYQAQAPIRNTYGSAYGAQHEEAAAGMMAGGINAASAVGTAGLFVGPMLLPGRLGNMVDDVISPVSMRGGRPGLGMLGRVGRSVGRGMGGALTFGSRAGMMAGGFTGAAMGIAAPLAGMMAVESGIRGTASNLIEGQQEFLATRQLMRSMTGNPQSVLSQGLGIPTGAGQVSQFQNAMTGVGAQFDMSSGQSRNMFSALQSSGQIDTSSIRRASESFRRSLQELREISDIIGADVQQAHQAYQAVDQMGIQGGAARKTVLSNASSTALMTGSSLGDVLQYGAAGSQAFAQQGMSASNGARLGMNTFANTSLLASNGMLPSSYVQSRGGVGGVAQRMMQYQMGFAGSAGGQQIMSQIFSGSGALQSGSGVFSGEEASYSSQFFRELDPYQMSSMRERMTRMQGGIVLSRVGQIRREADSASAANREQFEFLSSLGISDPEDQLSYLQTLQNQGSTSTLQALQGGQDAATTSYGNRVNQLRDRGQALQNALSDIVDSVTTDLQNLGGALQVASERYTSDMQAGMFGRSRTYSTDVFNASNFNAGRQNFLRGDMVGRGALMPIRGLEEVIGGSSALQASISGSANMTGEFRRSSPFLGGASRMLQNTLVRAPIRAREMGMELLGAARDGLTGGGFDPDFSRGLGGGYSDRYFTASADDPGAFGVGRGRYATAGMVMQAAAADFGQIYDIESGTFARADQAAVRSMSARFGGTLERDIASSIEQGQSSRRGRGLAGARGFINDFRSSFGMETQPRLGNALQRDLNRGQLGAGIRDDLSQNMFGRAFEELNSTQQATLREVIARNGGQYGRALSQDFQIGEGISEAEFTAIMAQTSRDQLLGQTFGIGDDGYSAIDNTRNGSINLEGMGLAALGVLPIDQGNDGDLRTVGDATLMAIAGGINAGVNAVGGGSIRTSMGSRGFLLQNQGTTRLNRDQRRFAAASARVLRQTQNLAEDVGFSPDDIIDMTDNHVTSLNVGATNQALDQITQRGSDRQIRRAAELRNELNTLVDRSLEMDRFVGEDTVRQGALGLLAPGSARGRANYDIQNVNSQTAPILQGRLRALELMAGAQEGGASGGITGNAGSQAIQQLLSGVAANGTSSGDAAAAYELLAMQSGTMDFDVEAELSRAARAAGVDVESVQGLIQSTRSFAGERRSGAYADSADNISSRRAMMASSISRLGAGQAREHASQILGDVSSLNRVRDNAVFASTRNRESREMLAMLEQEEEGGARASMLNALRERGFDTDSIMGRLEGGESIFEVLRGDEGARDTLRSQVGALREAGQDQQAAQLENYMYLTGTDGNDAQLFQRHARMAASRALRGGSFQVSELSRAGYTNVSQLEAIFNENVGAGDASEMLLSMVGGEETLNALSAGAGFQEGLSGEELVERLRSGAAGGEGSASTFDLLSTLLASGGEVGLTEEGQQAATQSFRDKVVEHLGTLASAVTEGSMSVEIQPSDPG